MTTSPSTPHRVPVLPTAGLPSLADGAVHQSAVSTLAPRRRVNSQTLLGNEREVEIEHSGQLYRLRLTSLGKLILTK